MDQVVDAKREQRTALLIKEWFERQHVSELAKSKNHFDNIQHLGKLTSVFPMHKQLSVLKDSFLRAPPYFRPIPRKSEPRAKYRYLADGGCGERSRRFIPRTTQQDGHPAVLWTTDSHDPVLTRINQLNQTKKRFNDGIETHFTLGSDERALSTQTATQYHTIHPSTNINKLHSYLTTPIISSAKNRDSYHVASRRAHVHRLKYRIRLLITELFTNPRDLEHIVLQKAFEFLDVDNDGKISLEDLTDRCVLSGIASDYVILRELFKGCDKDDDGYLDLEECSKYLLGRVKLEPTMEHKKSLMHTDYCPLANRGFTKAQNKSIQKYRNLVNQPRFLAHLFHTDHPVANNFISVTRRDFPEIHSSSKPAVMFNL